MNTFGAKLRSLRKQKDLSQAETARLLGYSRVQVSNWEIERSEPDIQALAKLAEFYGVTVDYITGKVDSPTDSLVPEKKQTPADTAGINIGSVVEERPAAYSSGPIELTDILIIENKNKITYMGMEFSEDDIIITRDLIEAAFKPRLPKVIPIYPPPPPRDYSKIPKIEDIDPDQVPLPEEFMFKDQRINRYEYLQAEGRLPTDEDWKNLVSNYKDNPPK